MCIYIYILKIDHLKKLITFKLIYKSLRFYNCTGKFIYESYFRY